MTNLVWCLEYVRGGVYDIRWFETFHEAYQWAKQQKEFSKKYGEDFVVIGINKP